MRRVLVLAVVLLAAGAAVAAYWLRSRPADATVWRTATIDRGSIQTIVSSTGKLSPLLTVAVGSQVSGNIFELPADFNSVVKQGDVIARIDPAAFEARVRVARAELAQAHANVEVQKATLTALKADLAGTKAALHDSEQDLQRKQSLVARRITSQASVDTALAVRDQAKARLDGANADLQKQAAQILTAEAQVEAKQATLQDRELDLANTYIRSPVDGVVIARSVDIGQTVAASLQAPVLFTIAQDLSQMQVEVSVDEADVGRVRDGQPIRFTVDAFPRREFTGEVVQIRKEPKEVSNVVTYMVVASAANPDLSLLPGMTANVDIIIGKREDVVKVPEAALRFTPPGMSAAATGSAAAAGSGGAEAARARIVAMIKRLSERLKLSDEQRAGVRDIFRDTAIAIRDLHSSGAPAEEVEKGREALRLQARQRITGLLDEKQKEAYRRLQAEIADTTRGRVWIVDDAGEPKPVDVVVGLSDGNVAEKLRGEHEARQRELVGVERSVAK